MGISIRPMTESDLPMVVSIMHAGFNQFVRGTTEGPSVLEDRGYERRFFTSSTISLVAEDEEGNMLGAVFANMWGTVGSFGPIMVHPSHWDKSVSQPLLKHVHEYLVSSGATHTEIFTFPHSIKHHHLYSKYTALQPGSLSYILEMQLGPEQQQQQQAGPGLRAVLLSSLGPDEQEALRSCLLPRLLEPLHPGLDVWPELEAFVTGTTQGQVLLLYSQEQGKEQVQGQQGEGLCAVAVMHMGPGSNAGTGRCWVRFGAAADAASFDALLQQLPVYAQQGGCSKLELGVNLMRTQALDALRKAGFKAVRSGLSMTNPSLSDLLSGRSQSRLNSPDAFVIADFR